VTLIDDWTMARDWAKSQMQRELLQQKQLEAWLKRPLRL